MTQHYIFYESGVIPGIPGTFAHCIVWVADDGTYTVEPLAQQPHFPEESDALAVEEEMPEPAHTAEAASPLEVSTPDEQPEPPAPAPIEQEAPAAEPPTDTDSEAQVPLDTKPEQTPEVTAPQSAESE